MSATRRTFLGWLGGLLATPFASAAPALPPLWTHGYVKRLLLGAAYVRSFPIFDIGTDNVTTAGLAYAHTGERVVPGPAGWTSYTVSAIDSDAVARFFERYSSDIARKLGKDESRRDPPNMFYRPDHPALEIQMEECPATSKRRGPMTTCESQLTNDRAASIPFPPTTKEPS